MDSAVAVFKSIVFFKKKNHKKNIFILPFKTKFKTFPTNNHRHNEATSRLSELFAHQ